MMDRTDRHFRHLIRLITKRTLLYTEMIHVGAVRHGDRDRLLAFELAQHPISLQLGGDDAGQLAEAARIGAAYGYDEINLNVGCPSERVSSGNFGACLMLRPDVVGRAVDAMRAAVDLPITVKHRIGVDDVDRYEDMERFVRDVASAGADAFTVHARKAWLHGLSPKENRTIPPLRYEDVYRLKEAFPELIIELNGGVRDLRQAGDHLRHVDAVMLGRAVVDDPFVLENADEAIYGERPLSVAREDVVRAMAPYVEARLAEGATLPSLVRPLLTLFRGMPGGKRWRRYLSEHAHRHGAGPELLERGLAAMADADADHRGVPDVRPAPAEEALAR